MNKVLTLLLIVIGLLLAAILRRNAGLIWLALPYLAYLGIGFLKSPSRRELQLQATRSTDKTQTGKFSTIDMKVEVGNHGATLVRLSLSDPLQPGMRLTRGPVHQYSQPATDAVQAAMILPAGDSAAIDYAFQSERGNFEWKTLRATVSDPFGLIDTELELPAAARIQVQPELGKFRRIPLHPQRTLHSAGSIPARRAGGGTDFWGVREYHAGDPLHRLDWRLTARHPRKFFTKEFEQEEIADIGLILDARQSLNLTVGDDSLFEHTARATASLAEAFLRQGDRVSLLVYQQHMLRVFPGYGKQQLNRILRTLARVTPDEDGSMGTRQFVPIQMFSSHSLIVVLSPLVSGDWWLFRRLRAYGYQVLLISPDPLDFIQATLPTDPASRLAARLTRLERQLEFNQIKRLWMPVIDWPVNQPLAPLVRQALKHTPIQRRR